MRRLLLSLLVLALFGAPAAYARSTKGHHRKHKAPPAVTRSEVIALIKRYAPGAVAGADGQSGRTGPTGPAGSAAPFSASNGLVLSGTQLSLNPASTLFQTRWQHHSARPTRSSTAYSRTAPRAATMAPWPSPGGELHWPRRSTATRGVNDRVDERKRPDHGADPDRRRGFCDESRRDRVRALSRRERGVRRCRSAGAAGRGRRIPSWISP